MKFLQLLRKLIPRDEIPEAYRDQPRRAQCHPIPRQPSPAELHLAGVASYDYDIRKVFQTAQVIREGAVDIGSGPDQSFFQIIKSHPCAICGRYRCRHLGNAAKPGSRIHDWMKGWGTAQLDGTSMHWDNPWWNEWNLAQIPASKPNKNGDSYPGGLNFQTLVTPNIVRPQTWWGRKRARLRTEIWLKQREWRIYWRGWLGRLGNAWERALEACDNPLERPRIFSVVKQSTGEEWTFANTWEVVAFLEGKPHFEVYKSHGSDFWVFKNNVRVTGGHSPIPDDPWALWIALAAQNPKCSDRWRCACGHNALWLIARKKTHVTYLQGGPQCQECGQDIDLW